MLIFERYRAQLNTLKNRVEARLKAIGHAVADRVDKDPWETLSKMGLLPVQPEPTITEAPVGKVNLQLFGEVITADIVKTFPRAPKRKPRDTTAPLEELEVGQEVPPGEPCPVLERLLGLNLHDGKQATSKKTAKKTAKTHSPECEKQGEAYECEPGCPVAELDRQSVPLKSGTLEGQLGKAEGDDRKGALGMFEPGKSFEPTNLPSGGRWPSNLSRKRRTKKAIEVASQKNQQSS